MKSNYLRYILPLFVLLTVTWIISCSGRPGKKPAEITGSGTITKEVAITNLITITVPAENSEFKLGEPVKVVMAQDNRGQPPDSILIFFDGKAVASLGPGSWEYTIPSSFTGTNLLTQELLADYALRYEADRQQKRLDYFRQNTGRFERYLKPKQAWGEYNIHSFLVTKQIPLAHRYKEVKILRATEFLQTLS